MPDISISFHLHQPRLPRDLRFERGDDESIDHAYGTVLLNNQVEKLLLPFMDMMNRVYNNAEIGTGIGISGSLIDQLEISHPETLSGLQKVWQHPATEIIPQPYNRTAQVIYSREEWVADIQRYRERLGLMGATLSPVLANPGYLFISYLAWPLQELGIGAVMVDGDGFGWSGKWANRISRVSFQHSFRVLTRNSGWSNRIEQLDGIEQGPIHLARTLLDEFATAGNEPVVLSVDLMKWLNRPALIGDAMTLLYLLLTRGADHEINWVAPGFLLNNYPVEADFDPSDWVVSPESQALLGNSDSHPIAADVRRTWEWLKANGKAPDLALLDEAWITTLDHPLAAIPGSSLVAGQIYARLMGLFSDMKEQLNG